MFVDVLLQLLLLNKLVHPLNLSSIISATPSDVLGPQFDPLRDVRRESGTVLSALPLPAKEIKEFM